MRKNTNANKNIRTNLRRNPQVCFVHPGYGNHGALNSPMRHRYLHSFFVFVSYYWEISRFMECTSYVFSFRMMFFSTNDHGWIFYIRLCENSINHTGRDGRACLARPNSRARTGTGKNNLPYSPIQLTTNMIGNLTRLIPTFAICDDHTYIYILYTYCT